MSDEVLWMIMLLFLKSDFIRRYKYWWKVTQKVISQLTNRREINYCIISFWIKQEDRNKQEIEIKQEQLQFHEKWQI